MTAPGKVVAPITTLQETTDVQYIITFFIMAQGSSFRFSAEQVFSHQTQLI